MIKFLQKLVILWEKSKFLTLMELESDYLQTTHNDILMRDIPKLREELADMKAIKKSPNEVQQQIIELESQINETEKFRQMIQSSQEKGKDLKNQIRLYKENLWK